MAGVRAILLAMQSNSNNIIEELYFDVSHQSTDLVCSVGALEVNSCTVSLSTQAKSFLHICLLAAQEIPNFLPHANSLRKEDKLFHHGGKLIEIMGIILLVQLSISLQNITITLELVKVIDDLRERVPGLNVTHGGLGAVESRAQSEKQKEPMVLIKQYIDRANLRLVDFFNSIDKDKSMSVTVEEFEVGLAVSTAVNFTAFSFPVCSSLICFRHGFSYN